MQRVQRRDLMSFSLSVAALATAATVPARSPRDPSAPPPPLPSVAIQPAKAAPDMQVALDPLQALGVKPFETLILAQARAHPTPADSVKAVMAKRGMPTAPDPAVATQDMPYGSDPLQFVRVDRPASAAPNAALPVIVYWHGGGWVLADVNVYDAAPRMLAKELNATVLSVEYQKAPEAKFPSQHEDAIAAYRFVLAYAAGIGGDTFHMAFAGESAGGDLTVATAIHACGDRLPPTIIVNAQIDPLRSDGETLAQAMRAAGVRVEQRTFPAVTHEMFGIGKVVRGAMDANIYAVGKLKAAFASGSTRPRRR